MALTDDIEKIEAVFDFMERVHNIEGRGLISAALALRMIDKALEYLMTLFPEPEEPE